MTFGESWKLQPNTAEEVKEVETIEGKRARLNRFAYESPLVKAVFDSARYRGLSGDDTMTWLAYEALLRVEQLESLLLDIHGKGIPPIYLVSQECKGGDNSGTVST